MISQGVILLFCGRLSIVSGTRVAEAAEEYRDEEQNDAHRDSRIRKIKNGKIEIDLRNAKSDEIYHIACMSGPVDNITQRAAYDHAKNEFDRQRSTVYHAHIHVRDDTHRDNNQPYQHNAIGKEAEGRPIVLDIE